MTTDTADLAPVRKIVHPRRRVVEDAMPGVGPTLREFQKGTLRSGSKRGPVVKSRAQAIAIGLSEERKEKGDSPREEQRERRRSKKARRPSIADAIASKLAR